MVVSVVKSEKVTDIFCVDDNTSSLLCVGGASLITEHQLFLLTFNRNYSKSSGLS